MKTLKKLLSIGVCATLAAFSLAGCSTGTNDSEGSDVSGSGDALRVGIIQYMSHPSLDNCYTGIKQALDNSGLNIEYDYQIGSDASADADCASFASNMVAQDYDLLIAIATPAATSAYAATEGTDIPVIFCAVNDPVAAELVADMDAPGDLCTGTSDVLDLSAQVDMIQAMQPDVKTIGVLYTTSEANSITNLERLREIASERDLTIEASGVQNASDIPAAATALAAKVDCINNFTDNNVVNNLPVVLEAANDAGIPVYGSEIEQVKNGCLAAVSIDYVALGETTGNMAVKVLGGADPATMAVQTITDASPVVNTDVLAALDMTMPQAYADVETVATNA